MTFGARALKIYNHVRHTADRVSERGWRRCFGWLGVGVAYFTFIYAPSHGIAVDAGAANAFLTMVTGTFVMRGVERINQIRAGFPDGGLVNNQAIRA